MLESGQELTWYFYWFETGVLFLFRTDVIVCTAAHKPVCALQFSLWASSKIYCFELCANFQYKSPATSGYLRSDTNACSFYIQRNVVSRSVQSVEWLCILEIINFSYVLFCFLFIFRTSKMHLIEFYATVAIVTRIASHRANWNYFKTAATPSNNIMNLIERGIFIERMHR